MTSELDRILNNQPNNPPINQINNRPNNQPINQRYASSRTQTEKRSNKVGSVLFGSGLAIIILGGLASLIIALALKDPETLYLYSPDPHPLRWVYGLSLAAASFISGMLCMGFAEAIKLLEAIRQNTTRS